MKAAQIEFGSSREGRYTKGEPLGQGAYGIVYKAKDNDTGSDVALKEYRLEARTEGVPATALKEVSLLRRLSHPNIVRYLLLSRQCL